MLIGPNINDPTPNNQPRPVQNIPDYVPPVKRETPFFYGRVVSAFPSIPVGAVKRRAYARAQEYVDLKTGKIYSSAWSGNFEAPTRELNRVPFTRFTIPEGFYGLVTNVEYRCWNQTQSVLPAIKQRGFLRDNSPSQSAFNYNVRYSVESGGGVYQSYADLDSIPVWDALDSGEVGTYYVKIDMFQLWSGDSPAMEMFVDYYEIPADEGGYRNAGFTK